MTNPDSHPLVSVIVLSLNGEDVIRECLDTLRLNDYPNFEMMVVNNGSTDRTPEIVANEYPDVQLVNLPENRGYAGGMNEGIKACAGDIIVPLNDDTILTPTVVREIVEPLRGDPAIGIVGCKILYPDRATIQHAGGVIGPDGSTEHIGYQEEDRGQHDVERDVDYVTGCMIAIRRELFEQLGLYDDRYFPTYYEEVEFAVRARRAGYRIVYAPRALLYHIESKTEVVKSHKFYFRFHRSRWRFVLKNFTPRGILRALKHEIPHFRATIDPVERNALLRAYGYVLARLPRILYDRNHRFLPLGKRPTRTTQPAMQEAV
jgi:hypothetical protein